MGGLYWFGFGSGRRYLGAVPMLFGALLLGIMTWASCDSDGPGPAVLAAAIVASVSLGWLGYKVQRWMPREPSAEPMLAARPEEKGEKPPQVPCPGAAAASQATSLKRKANSRCPSLFVSYGRFGHGGRSAK